MAEADKTPCDYVVICVDGDPNALASLQRSVEGICGPEIGVRAFRDAEQVLTLIDEFSAPDIRVPLIITEHILPGMSGVDLLLALHERRDYRATRKVLASTAANVLDLSRVLNQGALQRLITRPSPDEQLRECIRALLTSFFIHHAPAELDRFADLLDTGQFPRAYTAARHQKRALDLQISTLKRSFLATTDMSDEQVERAMATMIDQALDNPPRQSFAAGAILVRQDEPVDTILILLSGQVQLSRKTNGHEVVLHTHSAGRIIGLLSLAHRGRAFYTCRAATDLTALPLTLEQLETALQADPWFSGYFVTALIRSLATRTKRTAQLKVEVEDLNRKLRAERDQLADALDSLEHAQTRLVESEKMATLGQLTAGMAHELNNPVAAIRRVADFLAEDVTSLVTELPDSEAIQATLRSALESTPISTRELRKRTAALSAAVGDEVLTRRLVKVGITTPDDYRDRFRGLSTKKLERLLGVIERCHQLGTSLRTVRTCSDRISGIVESLRSYARSDQEVVGGVDVHEGLEDTLRLLDHDLRTIQVEHSYGELPRIECRVGQLNQVWTNLISNAAQAMHGTGTLRIKTDAPDADSICVRIIDSGKGVPPDLLDRVFDLHFTTRNGRVEFGLGMGLPICRQIVARHGGSITVESKPGETCFTVALPVRYSRVREDACA